MPRFCTKCGNQLKDNDKFCRKCGSPVGMPEEESPQVISEKEIKKGKLQLSLDEMLRGGRKVLDFGTGKKYEIIIPAGLTPGDVIQIKDAGIIDPDSGRECEVELTTSIE